MATNTVFNTNLEQPPFRIPMYDQPGVMNSTWVRYFQGLFDRVGGSSGSVIYDNADAAQTTSSLEPQLFAIRADLENQLTGIVLQIIEQVQDTFQPEPPDLQIAGVIQQSIDASPVQSVFGRTGIVTATEGDYSLNLLGDVTVSGPLNNEVLKYNGSAWVNAAAPTPALTTIAPAYESITATAGQTIFNTTVTTTANGAGKSYLLVTRNGIVLDEGGANDYTVTGATQITLTAAAVLNDKITLRSWG